MKLQQTSSHRCPYHSTPHRGEAYSGGQALCPGVCRSRGWHVQLPALPVRVPGRKGMMEFFALQDLLMYASIHKYIHVYMHAYTCTYIDSKYMHAYVRA